MITSVIDPKQKVRKVDEQRCRVCHSQEIATAGEVEYYLGYSWSIYDCAVCGCRFTKHDESIYNWLHERPDSVYGLYRELADNALVLFRKRDLEGLRGQLSQTSKYRFVIDSIERRPKSSHLLEVGCSRGQLTSYFILAGYDILGTDVSPEAISAANAAFGDFFVTADSPLISQRGPYDIVYHTGMIGCVADPIQTTNELLALLRPGGRLLFNAPNKDACALKGQLWINASPPPDVVTLFPPCFWQKNFSDSADVEEAIERLPSRRSFEIGLRRTFGPVWKRPQPIPLESSVETYKGNRSADQAWLKFERMVSRLASATGLTRLAPSRPTPFGVFVTMIRR